MRSSGIFERIRPLASWAMAAGSVVPSHNASSMRPPETPRRSVATAESLTPASSSSFSSRWSSLERSLTQGETHPLPSGHARRPAAADPRGGHRIGPHASVADGLSSGSRGEVPARQGGGWSGGRSPRVVPPFSEPQDRRERLQVSDYKHCLTHLVRGRFRHPRAVPAARCRWACACAAGRDDAALAARHLRPVNPASRFTAAKRPSGQAADRAFLPVRQKSCLAGKRWLELRHQPRPGYGDWTASTPSAPR
jgi:hypothetical protein